MLYIRTDMNSTIAAGHIMRCLSIADALRELGEKTIFIIADMQAKELLESRGYDYIVLNTSWNELEEELTILKKLIKEHRIKTILIDSYQVTFRYLEELTKWTKTVYIDDLYAFVYPVNEVICYANYAHKFLYENENQDIKVYRGTKYVPLRKEFWNCEKKQISDLVKNLLLLSGGSDPYDILGGILEELDRGKYQNIDVICGVYNSNYYKLCKKYADKRNISIHRGVSDMIGFMKKADLAVSAGGTTLYELCACGTPTISYAFADNQLDNVRKFAEDRIIDYAGDARVDDVVKRVHMLIEVYESDWESRQNRSEKMQELVDGKGALRIAEQIINVNMD